MKATTTAFVALLCAVAPLLAPQAWAQHGLFPDFAALAVLHLAIAGSPERAAYLGVAVGLLRAPFTAEPLGLDAALYGALGWSCAHVSRAVFQDRLSVKMIAAGLGAASVRGASAAIALLTSPRGDGAGGLRFGAWASATSLATLATALAAPFVLAALDGGRGSGRTTRTVRPV